MEPSDWVVVIGAAVFLPAFLIGLFVFGRDWHLFSAGETRTTGLEVLTEGSELRDLSRTVAGRNPECTVADDGGLRFVRRGVHGRLDFIAGRTEIQIDSAGMIQQVVEVVPVGFPTSWFQPPGQDRLRARGSKAEYDRIFKSPAEERLLVEIGVPYELRIAPDGIVLRLLALPQNAPALGYWLGCAWRLIDLLPGIDAAVRIEVTGVQNQVSADTMCQVCGSSLASGAIVRCAVCRTPHHQDCWQYAQKCSTFACTSQRSIP